jgi:hypothetical protein
MHPSFRVCGEPIPEYFSGRCQLVADAFCKELLAENWSVPPPNVIPVVPAKALVLARPRVPAIRLVALL